MKLIKFLFLILLGGCVEAKEVSFGIYVDEYKFLIGKNIPDLKVLFGEKNMKPYSLPSHDPGNTFPVTQIYYGGKKFFILGIDKVDKLLFRSSLFKTNAGAQIGKGYCKIFDLYPGAKFIFGFKAAAVLKLKVKSEGFVFNFNTSELPIGKYVAEGEPSKKDKSLCASSLIEIEIY